MSDFNKIMAFQQMMPYLNREQQENLATTLGMDLQEIERRLVGKNKEDEFVLILLFMEVCKSITGFDEGVSQLLKTATSDLLIELRNGDKFMLEIKHTDKERYSISMGNLQKRIEYANNYGLDLFFAISIKGYWMLFSAEYLKQKNGKIDVSDLTKSKLDETLGCVSYIFPKGLRIKSVYSTEEAVKSTGIQFPPYGKLVSYELYYNDRKIFRVKGKNSPYIGYTMILEALQDRLSMDTQIIKQALLTTARKHLCQFAVLKYQQMDGLNTALPFGVRKIDALRTLTTESLAVFIPFRVQEIYHENGVYYGQNVISKNMIIANRRHLLNGNSFILGVSGAGKSFTAKEEMTNIILTDPNADVLDSILNRITQNRAKGRNTFIFIDEIYLLFQHEYSANFLFTLWKRVRKYGAYCTGITQNVDDLLQSHTARTMLANSEFIIMLNQASTDRIELAKLLNISDLQMSYITNVGAGQGLLKVGSSLVPFVNKFPRNTELYKLMTTKFGEV